MFLMQERTLHCHFLKRYITNTCNCQFLCSRLIIPKANSLYPDQVWICKKLSRVSWTVFLAFTKDWLQLVLLPLKVPLICLTAEVSKWFYLHPLCDYHFLFMNLGTMALFDLSSMRQWLLGRLSGTCWQWLPCPNMIRAFIKAVNCPSLQ